MSTVNFASRKAAGSRMDYWIMVSEDEENSRVVVERWDGIEDTDQDSYTALIRLRSFDGIEAAKSIAEKLLESVVTDGQSRKVYLPDTWPGREADVSPKI